jgi:hypothetical protein
MKFVAFVGTEGKMPADAVAEMNRDFPAYLDEMQPRGVRLYGRELEFPQTATTVRVRNGETLVSDGPYAETKEYVGGLDVLECADLDEAIEVESKSPVARFLPFEIRPFREGLRLGPAAFAFGRGDDSAGRPYLFIVWASKPVATTDDYAEWQQGLDAAFAFGDLLGGPATATTLRMRSGAVELTDGPFLDIEDFIAGIDVVACIDRQQAISYAATHPMARDHAIEVRPFYSAQ